METISDESSRDMSSTVPAGPLTESEALALLKDKLHGIKICNRGDMIELSIELNYSPLALTQAAAYIINRGRRTIPRYLRYYRTKPDPLKTTFLDKVSTLSDDKRTIDPVMRTWYISFMILRKNHPKAADLLREMSFCDCRSIAQVIFKDTPKAGGSNNRENDSEIGEDVQKLIDNCFITAKTDGTFIMHRLVQVATRCWLEIRDDAKRYKRRLITRLIDMFPTNRKREDLFLSRRLLPHIKELFTDSPDIFTCSNDSYKLMSRATQYSRYDGRPSDVTMFCDSILERKEGLDEAGCVVVLACKLKGREFCWRQQWSEAEQSFLRGEAISERTYGKEAELTVGIIYNLMFLYTRASNERKVLELEEKVVTRCEKDKAWPILRMKILKESYLFQKKWQEAEELCEDGLILLQASDKSPERKEADVNDINGSLFSIYVHQTKWALAKEMSKRLLDYYVGKGGYGDLDSIDQMENHAKSCAHLKEYSEAKKWLEHALKIRRTDFPEMIRPLRENEMTLLYLRYRSKDIHLESYKKQMLAQLDLYRTAFDEDDDILLNVWHWAAKELRILGDLDGAISEMKKCWMAKKLKHCDGKSSTVLESLSLLDDWEKERDRWNKQMKYRMMIVFGRVKKKLGGYFRAN